MKWRNEPPDKPGWYWVRRGKQGKKLGIFKVEKRGFSTNGLYWTAGCWHKPVESLKWENAGPIAEPEEEE